MPSSKNFDASLIRRSLRTGESGWFSSARVVFSAWWMAAVTRRWAGSVVRGSTRLPEQASAMVAKAKVRSERFSPSNERTRAASASVWAGSGSGAGSLAKAKQLLRVRRRRDRFIRLIGILMGAFKAFGSGAISRCRAGAVPPRAFLRGRGNRRGKRVKRVMRQRRKGHHATILLGPALE